MTELDRLLELYEQSIELQKYSHMTESEKQELHNLKSQIESKLASYDFHIRHSKVMQELITKKNQELSQLREFIKKTDLEFNQALEELNKLRPIMKIQNLKSFKVKRK